MVATNSDGDWTVFDDGGTGSAFQFNVDKTTIHPSSTPPPLVSRRRGGGTNPSRERSPHNKKPSSTIPKYRLQPVNPSPISDSDNNKFRSAHGGGGEQRLFTFPSFSPLNNNSVRIKSSAYATAASSPNANFENASRGSVLAMSPPPPALRASAADDRNRTAYCSSTSNSSDSSCRERQTSSSTGTNRATTTKKRSSSSSSASSKQLTQQQKPSLSVVLPVASPTANNNSNRHKPPASPTTNLLSRQPTPTTQQNQQQQQRGRGVGGTSTTTRHPSPLRGRSSQRSYKSASSSACSSSKQQQQQPHKNSNSSTTGSSSLPPAAASRARSSSRGSRGRSNSRSRPPPTRNNIRSRSRSRSASLTRVTGPGSTSGSSQNLHPLLVGAAAPAASVRSNPSPHFTSGSVQPAKNIGRHGSSIGPGVTTSMTTSNTSDDDNIGREFSFGLEQHPQNSKRNSKIASSFSSAKEDNRNNNKKMGLLEKLFGDAVDKHTGASSLRVCSKIKHEIRPRTLLAATVYHNTATNLWITTINTNQRGVARDPTKANRYLKAFSFSTEREAREAAIANAPPKMVPFDESPCCFVCKGRFAVFRRACHCRNCGVVVCSNICSTTWPAKMIPDTYNLKKESQVKICVGCHSLSMSFKTAILDGNYEDAVALYGTGNVNLRTPFPISQKKDEVMFPIHCAVEGGNIDIVNWLIDDHFCPIKLVKTGARKTSGSSGTGGAGADYIRTDVPILTSKGRSLLSIAIDRVQVDIMRYLVVECGVSIYDSIDLKNTLRALEATLIALPGRATVAAAVPSNNLYDQNQHQAMISSARWDNASFGDITEPSSLGVEEFSRSSRRTRGGGSRASGAGASAVAATTDLTCILCFERKIDCCFRECGHQVCCSECSAGLTACPVCSSKGDYIKIF